MKRCEIKIVSDTNGLIKKVVHYFSSPAEKLYFEKTSLLHYLCETRWVKYHDCIS